jgi:hypothetical protein
MTAKGSTSMNSKTFTVRDIRRIAGMAVVLAIILPVAFFCGSYIAHSPSVTRTTALTWWRDDAPNVAAAGFFGMIPGAIVAVLREKKKVQTRT